MNIEKIAIESLIPYVNNQKIHTQEQIEKIAGSIKEFGFLNPIIVDKDNVIIAGHGRYEGAKKLGLEKVPVLRAEHLTPAQVKAYRIADNRLAELSGWDEELLKVDLEELEAINFDMDILGFNEKELNEILDDFNIGETDYEKADEVPEVEEDKKIVIKQGDLIELGQEFQHRILCGDSTKEEDVEKVLAGKVIDLIVTDPPYNVAYEGGTKDKLTIANDNMDNEQFYNFLKKTFTIMHKHLKNGGVFYIWHADIEGENFRRACREALGDVRQCLIWVKNRIIIGRRDYHWKHESCLYGWKAGAAHYWGSDRKQSSVLEFDRPTRNDIHPTMKPVALFEYLIKNSSKKGELVFDAFLGSGTTIIACENTKRYAVGVEYDPRYAQAIVQRYVDYTNNPKIKINGKEVDWYEYKKSKQKA
jgi:DNA modification methylase